MKKEKKIIILFIFMIVVVSSMVLTRVLGSLDEIWNYNNAKNIANGLIPYRDFNMITTPLLAIFCGIILKFTANELIVMRILLIIVLVAISLLSYMILTKLQIKKEISSIISLIIAFFISYTCRYLDYNLVSLLVILIIIYIQIVYINQEKSKSFLIGILAGIIVMLKQTVGICSCIGVLLITLINCREKSKKILLKEIILNLSGILIPIIIIYIYLYLNCAISDFINYAILGLSEFNNYISYFNLINSAGVLAIVIPVFDICIFIKRVVIKKEKKFSILLVYSVVMFSVVFPISDAVHFIVACIPSILMIMYEIVKELNNIKIEKTFNIILLIMLLLSVISIYSMVTYFMSCDNSINNYSYVYVKEKLANNINQVDEYVSSSEEKVLILEAEAAAYFIPIDIYSKNYDLLLKGNLGKNGEENIINEIKASSNTVYLILKDEYNKNWQLPESIINYVKDNFTKTGQVAVFDIYEKENN